MSHAFRSHLMQQFVAAARTQSRPPLALFGLILEEQALRRSDSSAPDRHSLLLLPRRNNNHSTSMSSVPHEASAEAASSDQASLTQRLFSLISGREDNDASKAAKDEITVSTAFQELLKTRRSCGRFAPIAPEDPALYKEALDRAVACALMAPNHKCTEPFRFKRLIGDSIAKLSEIAYQVNLRAYKGEDAEQYAATKRDKWIQVPAYLVVLVEDHDLKSSTELSPPADESLYDPLPYQSPSSERALEDYAAACAATQNILLSLHAEQIASKWATGPVIRTPAFRQLVHADPSERVVSMIMVGKAAGHARPRRFRKPWEDVLEDV